ncbi:MAG TPA: thioredoxin family protein [Bacteroidota bacterium]|nr:thioredoxin family protein [Bacteroidota bacterium]
MRIVLQMKTGPLLVSLLVGLCVAGCAGTSRPVAEPSERGWVSREILDTPPYAAFKAGYDTATIMPALVSLISGAKEGVDVTVFFGGWCPDSKREVPRFLKLADEAGFPPSSIRLYALDRTKKSDDGMTDTFGITRVPTFVFMKEGRELGRITEFPSTTIEGDVVTILAKGLPR